MIAIAVRYDLRVAPFAQTTHAEAYATCLEQVAWIEQHGTGDIIVLSEHHGVDDGFCPAPFTLAAAIAARTARLPIMIAAVLVPVTDPVRTAEQAVMCDLISGGRVSFVAGLGYRDEEFAMAGVDKKARARIFEEYVEVMRKAWTGEPFEWQGRTIRVTPKPLTQPHPPLLIGGSVEASARRAARMHLPFMPSVNDPALQAAYEDEAANVGFEGGFALMPNTAGMVFLSEDPDKTWDEIGRYALYDAQTYASWQEQDGRSQVKSSADDVEALRSEGVYKVLTPDEAVALAKANPGTTFTMHPLMAGLPAAIGQRSLELLRDEVLPKIRGGQA
jgi:alkanesulfonate monooxygenase SsuD/methylene tetrahydromethanopterin reductase-like flavin-dependent oxidoreductase (luciferase family)